nr:UvrD-like helicase, ATP-binding domain, P-loop containing nucleoside triphosphate hydrolase [Tanacetum cinerariifolium]
MVKIRSMMLLLFVGKISIVEMVEMITILGDLLLLVNGKPKSVSDLKRVGRTCVLAMVKSKEDDRTSIRAKTPQLIEFQDRMLVVFFNECNNIVEMVEMITILGDLLLLVNGKPKSVSDLKRVGRTCVLAMVKSKEDDRTSIRAKTPQLIEFQDRMLVVFFNECNKESSKTTIESGDDSFCLVGDLLLFGSKERLEVSTDT